MVATRKTEMTAAALLAQALLFLTAPSARAAETKGVVISAGGKAAVDIVTSANPSPSEKTARAELTEHLEKVTGAKLRSVGEAGRKEKTPAIWVGQTETAKKHGVDFSTLGEEEIIIKSSKEGMIITGGRPRGTLYAVYEFLERFGGCHWLAWDTTVTSSKPDFSVPEGLDIRMRPAFSPRKVYIAPERLGGGEAQKKFNLFTLRNRGQLEWDSDTGGRLAYNEGYPHTFYMFLDPGEWFAKHPEYYTMDETGKRTFGNPGDRPGVAGSELCLSNPELPGVMAERVLKYMREREIFFAKKGLKASIVDVTMEDNASYICKCPACAAISRKEGSESGLVIRFANKVAELVGKEYPEVKIRTFAYNATDAPPMKTKPADNLTVWWCDLYGKSDCFRPLEHPVNKEQLRLIQGWSEIAKNLEVWDYWNMSGDFSVSATPEFVPVRTIASDARLFKKLNVSGYSAEFEMGVTKQSFFALCVWAGNQLMFNPDLNGETLVSVFMDGYYGAAAPAMTEYYRALEQAMSEEEGQMSLSRPPESRTYLNMDFLAQCRSTLLRAESAVTDAAKERVHVWREMIVVYNCILNQWERFKRQTGREFTFSRQETMEKYAAIRKSVIDYCFADTQRHSALTRDLKREMDCLNCSVPPPAQFKDYPVGALIDILWPKMPPWAIKDDPEAAGGKAVYHKVTPEPGKEEGAPVFGLYDRADKRSGPTLRIENAPSDEKYHIYKIGAFRLGMDSAVWGHKSWGMPCANLASEYINADGMKDNPNEWDVYISVKITGPVYVPGSKSENALWCDRVTLVKAPPPGKIPSP